MKPKRRTTTDMREVISFRRVATALVLSFVGLTQAGNAQISFSRYEKDEPDIATYATAEQCLGVLKKRITPLTEPLQYSHRFRLDTFPRPMRDSIFRTRDNQPVIEAAKRCSAKFTVDGVLAKQPRDINETENAFQLLAYADRMAEAMELAQRWLKSFGSVSDPAPNYIALRLAEFLMGGGLYPPRYREALSFVQLMDTVKFWQAASGLHKVVYDRTVRGAFKDSILADFARDWILNTVNWVGDEVIQSFAWQDAKNGAGRQVASMLEDKERQHLWALLRQNTERYHDEIDSIRKRAKLEGTITRVMAPPIVAESWFPEKPAADRPTRGRVAVVSVISMGNNMLGRRKIGIHLDLTRMMQRFPGVEVTYVMSTMGFNGPSVYRPEDEAKMIDSLYRGKYKLPVTLAIHHRKFWRLPEPDRRRINLPGPNDERYYTLPNALFYPTYIIDREGRIIVTSNIDRDSQWWQHPDEGYLEAVLAQPEL